MTHTQHLGPDSQSVSLARCLVSHRLDIFVVSARARAPAPALRPGASGVELSVSSVVELSVRSEVCDGVREEDRCVCVCSM